MENPKKSKYTDAEHQKKTKKGFSGAYFSEWLRILEAVSTCFARGEAGYFPYHVVVEHMNEVMAKAG